MLNDISPEVAEVLRASHIPQRGTRALDARAVNELREIADGNTYPSYRVKALNALGRDAADAFKRALADRDADDSVRAAGATLLSRSDDADAEAALLAALDTESSNAVRHKIVAGLARIGGANAAQALEGISSDSGELARHTQFARTLIEYRSGVGAGLPETPEADALAPAEAVTDAELAPSNPYVAAAVVDQLSADSYGIALDERSVATLDCDNMRWAVAVDARLTDPAALRGPVIAAVLAVQAPADDSFHAALVVLSYPASDGGLRLSVNRLDGHPVYYGSGRINGGTVYFTVDAVRAPGAREKTIRGKLDDGVLTEIEVRAGQRFARREPVPMQR